MARRSERQGDMAALVRRAQAGDRAAFDELYRRTAQAQYFSIVGRVGREAAPDILQELYLIAWDRRSSIEPAAFVGYLNATARNLCKRYFKGRGTSKVPLPAEDEMLEAAGAERAVASPAGVDPVLQADERDEATRLARALREDLTDQERDAVLMRYYQDMKLGDIAASLGVSLATAKRVLNRALATLRRKVGVLPAGAAFADVLARAVEDPGAPGVRAKLLGHSAARGEVRRDRASQLVGAAAILLTAGAVLFAATVPRSEAVPEQPAPLADMAAADTAGPVLLESTTRDGATLLRLSDESDVAEVFCVGDDGARLDAAPTGRDCGADCVEWEVRLPSGTWQLHALDGVGNESVGTLVTAITPDAF